MAAKKTSRPMSRKDDDNVGRSYRRAQERELRFITRMDETYRRYGSYNKPSLLKRVGGARGMLGIFGNRVTEN